MSNWDAPSPRRSWVRRGTKIFVIVLLVLASWVGLDRFAAMVGEEQIGKTIHEGLLNRQIAAADPKVRVHGFPFLWQVVTGNYKQVDITLTNVRSQSVRSAANTLKLNRIDVVAHDVRARIDKIVDGGDVVATSLVGTTIVDYATVAAMAGQPGLELSGDNGQLHVRQKVRLRGREATLVGTGTAKVVDEAIEIRFTNVTAEGPKLSPALQELVSNYAERLTMDLSMPDLPLPLTLERVAVGPGGLTLTATGKNVSLR